MKLPNVKLNNIIEIQFLDHVEDGNSPIEFIVWGRVTKITKLAITVQSWSYADEKETDENNTKIFTILKNAITKLTILR